MAEGAPSSWRPPWLLTISASAPLSTARRASSGSMMPLMMILPPQRFLIHSTSPQFRRGSNWPAVQAPRLLMSVTPLTWPWMLPNWRLLVLAMLMIQRGLVARFSRFISVGLGG